VNHQNCSIVHRGFSVTTIYVGKTALWGEGIEWSICSRCASNGSADTRPRYQLQCEKASGCGCGGAMQVPEAVQVGRFVGRAQHTKGTERYPGHSKSKKIPIGRSDIATRRSTMLLFAVRMLGRPVDGSWDHSDHQLWRCDQRCMVDLGRLKRRNDASPA
jgi:hypothetical protein